MGGILDKFAVRWIGKKKDRHGADPKVDMVYIMIYILFRRDEGMQSAKLFRNGRSQAVRLPKELNFPGDAVYVQKVGETVILFPQDKVWETFLNGLRGFTDDFMADGREQPEGREREQL